MTETLLIKRKKAIFQNQIESNTVDYAILSDITLELLNEINFSKAKYRETCNKTY